MDDIVSPFDPELQETFAQAPKLAGLEGKRLTLLSISKPKSGEFLTELGRVLEEEHGARVRHTSKPTFARPAPADVFDALVSSSDAVVEALAD
tara:strand:+ start:52 stop:330 length:279 start_codon:yes stop_codon:yes gene_type:complete